MFFNSEDASVDVKATVVRKSVRRKKTAESFATSEITIEKRVKILEDEVAKLKKS